MTHPCKIKQLDPQPTLFIRAVTSVEGLPAVVGQSFARIAALAQTWGTALTSAPYAAYYNMDMRALEVELGFPIGQPLQGEGDIQAGSLPGGRAVSCLYTGPYAGLQAGYDSLETFIQGNSLATRGPWYEFYLNDVQTTPPDELQTELVAFLAE